MFDPVFAQDGYVYERYAISKYLRNFVDAAEKERNDTVIPDTDFLVELRDAPKEEQKAKMVFIRHAALRREIASSAFAPKSAPLLTPMVAASKFAFDRSTTGYFMFVLSKKDFVFKSVSFVEFADDICVFEFCEDDRILVLGYNGSIYKIIYDSNMSLFSTHKEVLHVLYIGQEKSHEVKLVKEALDNNNRCVKALNALNEVIQKDIHDETDNEDFDVVYAKLKKIKKNILPNLMKELGIDIECGENVQSSCPIQ